MTEPESTKPEFTKPESTEQQLADQRLEDRLARYGQQLGTELNSPSPRNRPLRESLPTLISAAAAVLVVGGLFAALRQPSPSAQVAGEQIDGAEDGDATDVLGESTGDEFAEMAQRCITYTSEQRTSAGDQIRWPFKPRTNLPEVTVIEVPNQAEVIDVLLLSEAGYYRCRLGVDVETVIEFSFGETNPFTLPAPGELRVVESGWVTDSGVRLPEPDSVTVIGRTGSLVDTVELELADGTIIPGAAYKSGWFIASGPVPADTLPRSHRLNWVLADGTNKSASVEELADPIAVESCITVPGCVEQRLDELVDEAVALDRDDQLQVLQDGVITHDELVQVRLAYAECLVAVGLDARLLSGGQGVALTTDPDGPAIRRSIEAQREECGRMTADLVEQAASLLGSEWDSALQPSQDVVFRTARLPTLDTDDLVGLAELGEGEPYLLTFGASWLGGEGDNTFPPEMLAAEAGLQDLPTFFVAATDPAPKRFEERVRAAGFETPIVLLEDEATALAMGIVGFPTTFYIDEGGLVLELWLGVIGADDLSGLNSVITAD